ncbi:UNVERIFIED_CONTAM: hypothetical protein GTU68_056616, partial [Idotea baltica]|nr:hypothetical protein [Idotea baltica]
QARKQHQNYVSQLRTIGLDVIELPPDENHPDCLFVEDTAVVCNGSALICRPAEPSRRNEVDYMRNILKTELELPVTEIKDESATLEGGDVLFTGKEFFVGLSGRTNEAGARAVAEAFPDFPCSPVKIDKFLHLKTLMTMAGPEVICVASDSHAQEALKRIENLATFRYKTLTVPDLNACNVLFANGTMLYKNNFPESAKIFEEKMSHWELKPISFGEMEKASGCLTCCSILVKKTKHMKKIM